MSGSRRISRDDRREERARPDLAVALDAVYGYATEPENWEEMNALLDEIAAGADFAPLAEGMRTHLTRAEELARRLHETPPGPAAGPAYSYLVIGRDFRILDISDDAAVLLTPLCRSVAAGAVLAFSNPENAARFRLLAQSVSQGAAGPVLLRLVLDSGEEAVFGYLVSEESLPEPFRRRLDLPGPARPGAVALVATGRGATDEASYRETFGLTRAEARLAAALKDGLSLKQASAQLKISVNTARNQIKSVFEKLGVNRQGDLIRHLTELSQLAAFMRSPTCAAPGPADSALPGEVALSFVGLPDGRKLAYRDYGRGEGVPVVVFPSSVSSSYMWPVEVEAATRMGLRLIVMERPGTGASTPDPDLTFESFARDFEFFADAIGLERFRLTARSSGAPFGLAVGARMGARVELLLLTSTRLGIPEGGRTRPLGMLGAFFNNLRRYPWLLDSTLVILRAKMSRNFLRPLVHKFFEHSPADSALIRATPSLEAAMVVCTMEAITHSYAGLLRESQIYLDGVSLDLDGLVAPLLVWHGEEDGVVPIGELRRRLDELGIAPAGFRVFPGDGHCFINKRYDDIYARLRAG